MPIFTIFDAGDAEVFSKLVERVTERVCLAKERASLATERAAEIAK
jgi:hypothetical protein